MKDKPSYEELEMKILELTAERDRLLNRHTKDGDTLNDIQLLRKMLNYVPDLIWVKDTDGRFIYANPAMCNKLLKCNSGKDALGKSNMFFARQEQAKGYEYTFGEVCVNSDEVVKKRGFPQRFIEKGLVRGELLILDVFKAPVFNDAREQIGIVGCGRDVTREVSNEQILRNFRGMIYEIADEVDSVAIQAYDESRKVTFWNSASQKIYGYSREEAIGRKLEDLIIPDHMKDSVIQLHKDWIEKGIKIGSEELVLRNKKGQEVHVFSSHALMNTVLGKEMLCIDIDLSDQRRAEAERQVLIKQLERARRLEAIGTLAGGVAHDFNNILAAIMGYSEIAIDSLPVESDVRGYLNAVLEASNRAVNLVRQILAFSHAEEQPRTPIKVSNITEEAMKLIRSFLPSTIKIELNLARNNDLVLADPTTIHQVIMNLSTNALHAMKNQKGVLKVSIEDREVTADEIPPEWECSQGHFVVIRVEDSGHGMDEETVQRIFEPYFTTKKREEGTGLGLATVHGIVKSSKGFISVKSRLGEGTAFSIFLPQHAQVSRDSSTTGKTRLSRGNARILYVDDEEVLCRATKLVLEGLGYHVMVLSKPQEALRVFQKDPSQWDLIISDQTMPDMTGQELAQAVFKIRPDVPFILCTGFTTAVKEQQVLDMGIKSFLLKPVSKQDYAKYIQEALS
ncbi:MAG: hypothetical protein CSA81_05420 [Acidobacteria bacterium]|nr:MAG: hypothetical protein CSA81_05420 [Acidobacteriota bacterium]PIE90972.1 MAG: hypothetical protein CR997_03690 [Acidobacteriota bacterium]